jgi:ABC-2 type transport system permease protein
MWLQTVYVAWSNLLAYRVKFFLLVIGPALVFFFVKFSLWSSIYEQQGNRELAGLSREAMLGYQAMVLIVSLLAQGHNSTRLAEDIRLGRITAYLIYPFSLFEFHASSFIALQSVQIITSSVVFLMAISLGLFTAINLVFVVKGLVLCFFVSLLWFLIQYCLGLLAFWLEQTWVMRVLFQIIAQFLSGSILPLEFFPQGLRDALMFSPFPYLTWVPAKTMLTGEGSIIYAVGILCFWIMVASLLARLIWNRGLRMYTGAGM